MAKRFTDTDLWKSQRWFKKLNFVYKLAFCYVKDCCNHAGIWNIDCSDLVDDLGIPDFDLDDFIASVNVEYDKLTGKKTFKERLINVNGKALWVTGLIQFQYEGKDKKVNANIAPVRTALSILQGYEIENISLTHPLDNPCTLLEYALSNNLISLTNFSIEGYVTPKEKDIDKDIVCITKGGVGEKIINSTQKQKNGYRQHPRGFKLEQEEIIAERMARNEAKANES